MARSESDGRVRESIDPDDYRGGFGLWSGTSFAAPVVAGEIAAMMIEHMEQVAARRRRRPTAVREVDMSTWRRSGRPRRPE